MKHRPAHRKHKTLNALSLAVLTLFAACSAKREDRPQGPSTITIGIQPNEAARPMDAFAKELGSRLGVTVKTMAPKDYAELVKVFAEGKVDFAFFSPLTFIQAEREASAKALLKKVYGKSEFYYAALLVRADSPYKTAAQLKGKRFGFVDPKSTSGFLVPRVMSRKVGFDPIEGPHEFYGTHVASVQALLDKKVDVVGVWSDEPSAGTGAWTDSAMPPEAKKMVRVVAVSDPIPNDAFAVREAFYRDHPLLVFKVMEAMIALGEDKSRILKSLFDVDRMATATTMHYESVRALEALVRQGGP